MADEIFFYDRLYGKISFSEDELKLLQTWEMQRLKHISLAAIDGRFTLLSSAATKLEHSLGAAHVARTIKDPDIFFATLLHDIATPPFSHASEYYMEQRFGKNHETMVADWLAGTELAKLVTKQGGNIDRIVKYIVGEGDELSKLVNGTIDIDNLDNSLRYGISVGLLKQAPYDPIKIAKAFKLTKGKLVLSADCIPGTTAWEDVRKQVYELVYSETNMNPGMMLMRALDFAHRSSILTNDFYRMNNYEAFTYLLSVGTPRTKRLLKRLDQWEWYPRVFSFKTRSLTSSIEKYLSNISARGELADTLARYVRVPVEDVCIHVGKNKAFKQIDIPFVGNGEDKHHKPAQRLHYMVYVTLHPQWLKKKPKVEEFMKNEFSC